MLCVCLDILIDMPIGALKSPDQKKKKWIYTDAFNMCIAQGEIYRQMRVRQSMNIPILLFSFWKHEFHIYNNNETAITLKPVENNIVAAIVFFFCFPRCSPLIQEMNSFTYSLCNTCLWEICSSCWQPIYLSLAYAQSATSKRRWYVILAGRNWK